MPKTRKQKSQKYEQKYSVIPRNMEERLNWMIDTYNLSPDKMDDIVAKKRNMEYYLQYFDYKIILYKIPEETYYITTNFNSDNDYQKFLNTIKERSVHNFSTNLTTEDKILTLSTCYSDTERTVVHAKLIKRSQK